LSVEAAPATIEPPGGRDCRGLKVGIGAASRLTTAPGGQAEIGNP